jgi:hypothetical protein
MLKGEQHIPSPKSPNVPQYRRTVSEGKKPFSVSERSLQGRKSLSDARKSFLVSSRGLSRRQSLNPAPEMTVSRKRHLKMGNIEIAIVRGGRITP